MSVSKLNFEIFRVIKSLIRGCDSRPRLFLRSGPDARLTLHRRVSLAGVEITQSRLMEQLKGIKEITDCHPVKSEEKLRRGGLTSFRTHLNAPGCAARTDFLGSPVGPFSGQFVYASFPLVPTSQNPLQWPSLHPSGVKTKR
jgi:hypothetical protein